MRIYSSYQTAFSPVFVVGFSLTHLLTHPLHSPQYNATVDENKAGAQLVVMLVTDGDEPHTPAWNAKFKIVSGDPGGLFSVPTGINKNEGILSTAKVGRNQEFSNKP